MSSDSIRSLTSSPNAGQEGNALHIGEEDELSEFAV